MKILFVTSYPLEYNASSNIRNIGLIEGLLANGHEVSTYSIYPTDTSLFSGKLLSLPLKKRYWIDGCEHIIKTNNRVSMQSFFLKKIKNRIYKLYNYLMIYDSRYILKKSVNVDIFKDCFDVVISSSDPKSAHLFVEELFKQNKKFAGKWIQYWGDPFTGDISYRVFLGNMRLKKEEKRLLTMADKAIYVSPFTEAMIKSKYPSVSQKISFLPIPFRLSTMPKTLYEFNEDKVVVGYLGDYVSTIRDITPFYQALCEINVESYIVGNSDIQLSSKGNITVKNRLTGRSLNEIIEKVNIIVCICNKRGTQIPGKIYHYVNSGKPILVVVDGENSDQLIEYLNSFERFYICKNSKEDILKCLNLIIRERKSFIVPSGLNPLEIACRFTN